MSSLRTHRAGYCLAISCFLAMALPQAAASTDTAAQPATALRAAPPDPLLHRFANCAGRLSALMEHQWLVDGPASETTRDERAAMLALLDAVMPPGHARHVLNWRIEAKAAHAALLTRATFGRDTAQAARAQSLATRHMAQCTALLLG
ncbi:hypothetical protein N4R57_08020 [Rhodobacteraceae bacterium D3-12]|nr:hypothetical protein N4R57_08020 [Rhodobacteraceae bacterium D3-12]